MNTNAKIVEVESRTVTYWTVGRYINDDYGTWWWQETMLRICDEESARKYADGKTRIEGVPFIPVQVHYHETVSAIEDDYERVKL